ncbi:MAG: dehydrogenase [Cryobacterium sp.]|nr:dehydrogenase [Oligoflexia bacterium]
MSTFRIANLAFGKSTLDSAYEFDYGGHHFEVQRYGTHFSIPYLKDLMRSLRTTVDAIALSDLPPPMHLGKKSYIHRQVLDVMATPLSIPLCDGYQIREIATVDSIARYIADGTLDPEDGIFFPIGLLNLEIIVYLREKYGESIRLGDAFSVLGIPKLLTPSDDLVLPAQALMNLVNLRDIEKQTPMASSGWKRMVRERMAGSLSGIKSVVSDVGVLALFGKDVSFIRGKDVYLTSSNPAMEKFLNQHEPSTIRNLFPENFRLSPFINYSVLDAALRLAHGKTAALSIEEWQEMLATEPMEKDNRRRYVVLSSPSLQTRLQNGAHQVLRRTRAKATPDFAFVVHPLSREDIFRVPGLRGLRNLPENYGKPIEKLISKAPGFVYGHIRQIVSEKNNREVNGIIYSLPSTPRLMKEEDPDVTYRKVERLCHLAAESGAKIIGLGAYTKVVGDSGETINRNSPIPVTTGNSLSASATLWAVHDAVQKMGILKMDQATGLVDGTAMVIGATGSIGKVSAKLLSLAFKKVILVAPRLNRLEELARDVRATSPGCEVLVTTDANELAGHADVLVTATSAFDQKIVDVMRLKPGCVVCDCSRPLDFTEEDARKRPDVLIIESGEVVLPGPVKLSCDLGLPDNSVYACLGETAILAMEGLYEPFTIGRDIDWLKVKKIYRLATEHGVKLATIRGHAGFVSEKEISIVRALALKGLSLPR